MRAARARAPARTRSQPRGAASSLPPSDSPSPLPEERAHLSPPLNPAAGRTLIPSASLPPGAGGSEAHEIAAMAGPTSRLLLLARRADRCRSLPLLLPRAVHAAAAAGAPSPTAPPPRLPVSAPVRRYRLAYLSYGHRIQSLGRSSVLREFRVSMARLNTRERMLELDQCRVRHFKIRKC